MLEHLLDTCLWLFSRKTFFFFFFPLLKRRRGVLKALGNGDVKLITQCLLT